MFLKKDITEKEIEILARTLTGVIRAEVLEDIHANEGGGYIPDEIMGETQDKIRNSLYNHLIAMNNVEGGNYVERQLILVGHLEERERQLLLVGHLEEGELLLYPVERWDEKLITSMTRFYAGDAKFFERNQ
jgi:hypothetical protein